jgi:hypothetical protein
MPESWSTNYANTRLDEFDSARGLYYEPRYPDQGDDDMLDVSDLVDYVEEDDVRTCPACRGRCYEDDFDSIPCGTCNGDGVVPN